MTEVVNLAEFKAKEIREDMVDILERALDRVRSGEAVGTVVVQTTDDPSTTYNYAAGRSCTFTMLGAIQIVSVNIANYLNDHTVEDIT